VSSILRFALYSSYGTEDDVQMERSRAEIGSWIYLLLYKLMSLRIIPDSMDIYRQLPALCLNL
jgi:hypothetical protein